jgi:flagellar protein FliO/FliZ
MIELVIRIAFSLLIVVGLLWGLAKLARRPLSVSRGGMLTVLARQQLTRGASVAVVQVADRALVLGVTDSGVSLLSDADLDALEEYRPEPASRRDRVEVDLPQREPVQIPALAGSTRSGSALAGSALSARTWRQAMEFIRERTARRS